MKKGFIRYSMASRSDRSPAGTHLHSYSHDLSQEAYTMKKNLITLAIASLVTGGAVADTNFSISGQINTGLDLYSLSTGTAAASVSGNETRLTDEQSRLVFKADRDLGDDLRAFLQVDMRLSTDTNQTASYGLTAGNTGVGLMGNWGKLTIGRWELHYNEGSSIEASRIVASQTLGTNGMLAQVNGVVIASGTRSNNVLMFDSPTVNGVTARLGYSTNPRGTEGSAVTAASGTIPVGDAGGGSAWTTALRYTTGPITTGFSYYSEDSEDRRNNAPNADQRAARVYLGYMLPMNISIGLTYDHSQVSAGASTANNPLWAERNAWLIPVKYIAGKHGVYFAYGEAESATGTGTVAGADTSAKFGKIGYDYSINKDASLGVFYTRVSNAAAAKYNLFALSSGGQTSALAGQSPSQLYAGLTFSF